jgi:hypothetical protein
LSASGMIMRFNKKLSMERLFKKKLPDPSVK